MHQKQIKFGIISTASISHKVCLSIQQYLGSQVVAVASRSLEKAQKWASEHNVEKAYGNYEELINDESVDAIYIPLPTNLKKEWSIKAAKNGKHILLEKPMPGEETIDDLQEIIEVCKANKVQFMDCTMWLHAHRTKDLNRELQDLGKISLVNVACTFRADQSFIDGNNIRTNNQNMEPLGCLGDVGWYCITAILFAYNYENPVKIQCLSKQHNKYGILIQLSGFLEFSNERHAYFDCSFLHPGRTFLEIVGEKGVIRVDDLVGGIGRTGEDYAYFNQYIGSKYYYLDDVTGKEKKIECCQSNISTLMIQEFVNLINSKDLSYTWSQKSLQTQRILGNLFSKSKP